MARPKYAHRKATTTSQKHLQTTDTEQVTKSQSLTLVKNLVRVSVSSVCFLRNVFPHSCFKERIYAGVRTYQLDASTRDSSTNETVIRNEEAYTLTRWLECGVIDAIERKYLRRMEFIVVSPELKLPRESYSFDLEYIEEGDNVDVMVSGARITPDTAKNQFITLVRTLIAFSHTLDELPREREINMKLWYYDERTPDDWQPEYFRPASPADLCFKRDGDHDNLRIRIGEVRTPHHTVKMRFEGIDATVNRDGHRPEMSDEHHVPDPKPDKEDLRNDKGLEPRNLLTCEAGTRRENEGDREDCAPVCTVSGMMNNLHVSSAANATTSTCEDAEESARIDDVRAWIATQAKPTLTGLVNHFGINRNEARGLMQHMIREGLVTQDAHYRYHSVSLQTPDKIDAMTRDSSDDVREGQSCESRQTFSESSLHGSNVADPKPDTATSQLDPHGEPASMPPPSAPDRRLERQYATPPLLAPASQPCLHPVPEKRQQAKVYPVKSKRILEDADVSEESEETLDPMSVFDIHTGTVGPDAALGYELSLSQTVRSEVDTSSCGHVVGGDSTVSSSKQE